MRPEEKDRRPSAGAFERTCEGTQSHVGVSCCAIADRGLASFRRKNASGGSLPRVHEPEEASSELRTPILKPPSPRLCRTLVDRSSVSLPLRSETSPGGQLTRRVEFRDCLPRPLGLITLAVPSVSLLSELLELETPPFIGRPLIRVGSRTRTFYLRLLLRAVGLLSLGTLGIPSYRVVINGLGGTSTTSLNHIVTSSIAICLFLFDPMSDCLSPSNPWKFPRQPPAILSSEVRTPNLETAIAKVLFADHPTRQAPWREPK
jgi:hypothetical protein